MKITKILLLLSVLVLWQGCSYTQKIKDGTTAYELKQFAVATEMLPNEFEKSKDLAERIKFATMLADSYRILNRTEQSKKWFLKAYELGGSPDALKQYAFALKQLEQYDEAAKAFEDLIAQTGDAFLWQKEVAACRQSKAWVENAAKETEYILEHPNFNSKAADYSPALYENNQLLFVSDRDGSTGEERYQWTGNSFSDLYLVDKNGGAAAPFEAVFNSPYNEGPITFNADFTEAYFSRCGTPEKSGVDYCRIMFAERKDGKWTKPVELSAVMIEKTNYSYPTLSADSKLLYFATDILDGYGGFDIYVSKRTADGWDLPSNIGSVINTEGNEIAPFIDADTLYFSSDFHVGMGGLDVFKTYRSKQGRWSPLQNLKAPINSGADDFGFLIDYQTEKLDTVLQIGYFTSNRKTNDDVFKFSKIKLPPKKVVLPPPTEIEDTTVVAANEPNQYILELRTITAAFAKNDDPSSGVVGKVELPNTDVKVSWGDTSFVLKTNEEGYLEMPLTLGQFYNFFGSKAGYLNNSTALSTQNVVINPEQKIRRFTVTLELNKVIKGKEFTLENIYYDFNKYEIRDDAKPTLAALARMLIENPSTTIQLSSHTDCRGNDNYNTWLSQKRAESAVNYLIENGVDADRLVAKGYGESRPTATCVCSNCTEDEHQANRRTTFTIL